MVVVRRNVGMRFVNGGVKEIGEFSVCERINDADSVDPAKPVQAANNVLRARYCSAQTDND